MTAPLDMFSRPFGELNVGESFRSRGRTITEADVVSFAAWTGDRHPIHTDDVYAKRSVFGGRIAHGMLLLSYAVGLVPLNPDYTMALRRVSQAVFKRPGRLGETMVVEGRVTDLKRATDEYGLVELTWELLGDGDAVLVRAKVEILWATAVAGRDATTGATVGVGS
jgi:acyl dehydratase